MSNAILLTGAALAIAARLQAVSPYGVTKLMGEQMLAA
jgi:UDP-glucose 4-epimerase